MSKQKLRFVIFKTYLIKMSKIIIRHFELLFKVGEVQESLLNKLLLLEVYSEAYYSVKV